jgi:hypothetical protein
MLKGIIFAATALSFGTVATAETLTIEQRAGGREVIVFEGEYNKGTGKRLYDLARASGVKYVSFNSGGGLAREGNTVAWVMENQGLAAIVEEGNICMSACAISVLGSEYRDIKGLVGFHPAYMPQENGKPSEAFARGQITGMNDTLLMLDKGVSRQIIKAIQYMASPDVFITFTSTKEFNRIFKGDFTATELSAALWGSKAISLYKALTTRGINFQ